MTLLNQVAAIGPLNADSSSIFQMLEVIFNFGRSLRFVWWCWCSVCLWCWCSVCLVVLVLCMFVVLVECVFVCVCLFGGVGVCCMCVFGGVGVCCMCVFGGAVCVFR